MFGCPTLMTCSGTENVLSLSKSKLTVFLSLLSACFLRESRVVGTSKHCKKVPCQELPLAKKSHFLSNHRYIQAILPSLEQVS